MARHRAQDHLAFAGGLLQFLSLPQRIQPGLYEELILAEFAAPSVRDLDPPQQAGLVHEEEASSAVAGCCQRALNFSFTILVGWHEEVQEKADGGLKA